MKFPELCSATERSPSSIPSNFSKKSSKPTNLFATWPPERCGVDGKYDYFGLVNRIIHRFEQRFGSMNLGDIRLTQRGAIVVLQGQFCDLYLLYELIAIALRTEGTEGVEINGITIFKSSDICTIYR